MLADYLVMRALQSPTRSRAVTLWVELMSAGLLAAIVPISQARLHQAKCTQVSQRPGVLSVTTRGGV